jgi:hypothetical protein
MPVLYSFINPGFVLIAFLAIVAVSLVAAYSLQRRKTLKAKPARQTGPIVLNLDHQVSSGQEAETPQPSPAKTAAAPPQAPVFWTFAARNALLFDLARIALVILALVVAGGFLLVILPQDTIDHFAQILRSRSSAAPQQEVIAFLYLGDEIKADQFVINGALRNISSEPIEKLDAPIRLYSPAGELLETVIVRMDKETIAPDEIAQFHLILTGYKGQYGSYAVDFRLRQGELVPYKDMRTSKTRG